MQSRNKKVLSVLSLLLVIAVVVGGGIWWKHVQDEKQRQHQLLEQRKELERVIFSLTEIYARWNDTLTLAKSTARIALSGPVGRLQDIRREALSLSVPACLAQAKQVMAEGMEKIIAEFISFMADPSRYVYLTAGRSYLETYEQMLKDRAC